jgi:hypothetical protein
MAMILSHAFAYRLSGALLAAWALGSLWTLACAQDPAAGKLPPVRAITTGPKFHWFAYYDKWQFDPTDRYVLGMEVDFEHRSPKADDAIRIGMVDLRDNDRWIELGTSRAWSWQQGCMLQWLPGSQTEAVWNDRQGDRFVCHVVDVKTRKRRTIPHAIYTVAPGGRVAVAPDFSRVQDMRPGYGYAGLPDRHAANMAPADSGIWRIDMRTGQARLIISLADVAKLAPTDPTMRGAKHYFNHLLFSPDGSRFIFLHRWRPDGGKGAFRTRMLTATPDGADLCVVDPSGQTSHFIWRDPRHILAWTRPQGRPSGFYLFTDRGDRAEQVGKGVMTVNGHCTYLPAGDGKEWILNDTYPQGPDRQQSPYLFHVPTGRRFWLGHFHLPGEYRGEWRCDTHPRFSRDGTKVVIDSPHGGGRQMWLIDASGIVKGEKRPS